MIPRDKLDEILNRLDIVSFISEYVPLKKMGRNFKGLCPFHGEKTPSFMVSQEKQIFHCFGCSEGGNLFGFLMKIEKLTFPEAARKLAEKGGVELPAYGGKEESNRDEADKKEILYKVNRYAAWYFAENLKQPGGKSARDYLEQRGIINETVGTFQLGYAPDGWEGLIRFFESKKIPLHYAEILGLAKKRKEGSLYDFFRNRLMFPIIDAESRVIGFGGRRLNDPAEEGTVSQGTVSQGTMSQAKYINSTESPIYHKGNSIYGLSQAKAALREKGEVILVEGNVDLLRLSQEGIKNVVAPLGTALSLQQIRALKRFAEKCVLLFDGDPAGLRATLRAIPLFFDVGIHPRVAELTDGEDPDSFVQKQGTEAMLKKITEAPLAMEWIILRHLSHVGGKPSQKIEASQKILPFIQALPSPLEKKSYLARLAQFLGLSEKDLQNLPKEGLGRQMPASDERRPSSIFQGPEMGGVSQKISLERILLQLYVKDPQSMEGLLGEEDFSRFEDEQLKNLGAQLKEQYQKTGSVSPEKLLLPDESPVIGPLLSELALAEEYWSEKELFRKMALDSVFQWKRRKLQTELKQITNEIQLAEFKDDKTWLTELVTRKNEVTKILRDLKPA